MPTWARCPWRAARVLAELEKPSTLGFGFHFGDQPFGYVLQNGENRTWQPVPTDALFPAPRTC